MKYAHSTIKKNKLCTCNNGDKSQKEYTVDTWIWVWLCGSTYTWIVFNNKNYDTTQSSAAWICGCRTMDMEELQIWGSNYKLYVDFWLHGGLVPLTCPLGQLYSSPLISISPLIFVPRHWCGCQNPCKSLCKIQSVRIWTTKPRIYPKPFPDYS